MPATIDQNLTPNAIVEFHSAKDQGKSDSDAWTATVARIRYDVLRMAIALLAQGSPNLDGEGDATRKECIHELQALQRSYEAEPDQPV